ncbi:MAG: oligosaccharide flippase family protein [Burkholderiales bacterium]|nr:oligosaccharide flippase family protein [Burkholderiales bacterium]
MNSVRRSVWLTFADSYVGLVLQVASTMIIARILTPQEIGVFAIAAVFSTLASMFRDFGVAEYLIQERELTSDKIAAALALNIAVSWAMAAAMFFGAPVVAHFYGYPGVQQVMHVQAIGFLLVPFGAVTMAWFRRELDFRPVMICNVAGNVTAFGTSVAMALAGWGTMALAWSTVAAIAVTVALSVGFRPQSFPRWPSLRGMSAVFHFSKFVSLMYIVSQVAKGLPEMIIGRALGAVEVAMFSRGNGLVEMFNRLVMRSVFTVCMPYLAKADREEGAIAPAYVRSVSYLTAVGWPFVTFVGIAAYSAIQIVYGPQWDAAVPIAQVLCVACAVEMVHCLSREALLTRGLAKEANNLQAVLAALLAAGLLVGVPFGLLGAAWGATAYSVGGMLVSQWFLSRHVGLKAADLIRGCLPSLALTVLTASPVALWAAVQGVGRHNYVVFGVGGGLLTVAAWLVGIHLLRHPLVAELEPIKRRLLSLKPST